MAKLLAHARYIIGCTCALALILVFALAATGFRPAAVAGQSDRKLGQRTETARRAAGARTGRRRRDQRPRQHSGRQVRHADPAGRPDLAAVPRGHAALDRRHRHPRHAGDAGAVLPGARHGEDRSRALRPHGRALQRVRAHRALDDGDLLHRAGAERPQHHVRQGAAAAAARPRGVRDVVAVGQVRPQLPELPVHHRRRADPADVDRQQHPKQHGYGLDQARRRHRRQRSSAGLQVQRRPEDDLLDRRDRRRPCRR